MIRTSKQADERFEAGVFECWCLHGAVGMAAGFRDFAKRLVARKTGARAVDLWRFLESGRMSMPQFGSALNAEAGGETFRGSGRGLLGYSMGGRLALHALLEKNHPWAAAVIVSAHPGLREPSERRARQDSDAAWARKAMLGSWQEFLAEWDAQVVLAGTSVREAALAAKMANHRGEIARSFVDWSLGVQEPLWERLGEIQIPVLWVAGENDAKFLRIAEQAAQHLPNARLAVAPGAGHRVPWEAADWLADEVAGFFRTGNDL